MILDENGKVIRDEAQKAFPLLVANVSAGRRARHRGGRAAGGADEFAGRRLQRLGHPVHDGLLFQDPPQCVASTGWSGSAASPPA